MDDAPGKLSDWLAKHYAKLEIVGIDEGGELLRIELVIRGWNNQFGMKDTFRFPLEVNRGLLADEPAFVQFLERLYVRLAERVVREGGTVDQTS